MRRYESGARGENRKWMPSFVYLSEAVAVVLTACRESL